MKTPSNSDASKFENVRPFGRARVLSGAVAGLLTFAGGRAARAADATLTVDAAQSPSGLPRPWTAAVGTGTASLTLRTDLQTHFKIVNRELGMQRVRGHGILNDDIGVFQWAGGTAAPTYNWTKFDAVLQAYVAAGMRPIMELSFMPTSLATAANNRNPPKDLTVYRQFIQAVVQHCVDTYGAADVGQWYWEVWNEPDYAGFWTGTQADYFALYDAAVAGATAALPNIVIGGPVTTSGGATYIMQFLQHTMSTNTRVSFVSSHAYGGGIGATADANAMATDNDGRVNLITRAGYSTANVKSLNSEFNSTFGGQGGNTSPNCVSMDSNVNAPFIAKAAKLISDRTQGNAAALDVLSYWTASDIFDEGSYIQNHNGLPFGQVFGLLNYQGIRKAAFNGFKMLNYLGPKRLRVTGGTGTADGIDALAAVSSAGDEVQILVYNYATTIDTTGTDNATVTVNNLPFAGRPIYVTQFIVDADHSNPYGVWLSQNIPTAPSEAQFQAMRQAQQLALLQPVSTMTAGATYTTTFALQRQGASLIILGTHRPLTGRNALVEMEGEDYDGQSGATKEDSGDTSLGQSIAVNANSFVFYDNVDFTDAGVGAVQLRVSARANATVTLHADSQTGPVLGTCAVASTNGAWATQRCTVTGASGVHTLYALFGGAMRLNWLMFEGQGADGGTTPVGDAGGSGMGGAPGAGGAGMTGGSSGSDASAGQGGGGGNAGASGGAGSGGTGNGGASGGGNNNVGGAAGNITAGGAGDVAPPSGSSSKGGCSCQIGSTAAAPRGLWLVGLAALVFGARRRKDRS